MLGECVSGYCSGYHYHLRSHSPSLTTLPYSDKDQVGDYTMLAGDIVHFHIATDRRDSARRATYVRLHRLIEDQKEKTGREKVGS